MSAAGLVRRVGTNLNQAVARLNATGRLNSMLGWSAVWMKPRTMCAGAFRDLARVFRVIGKVLRGTDVRRLLYYLYGLGKGQ